MPPFCLLVFSFASPRVQAVKSEKDVLMSSTRLLAADRRYFMSTIARTN